MKKNIIFQLLLIICLLSCTASKNTATITATIYDWDQQYKNHLVIYTTYKSSQGVHVLPLYFTNKLKNVPVLYKGKQIVITYDSTQCHCTDHSIKLIDIKKYRFKK